MATFNTGLFNTFLFGGFSGSGPTPPPPSGPGITVFDLIYHAYRNAGVLTLPGRSYSPEEYSDGFAALNFLIDAWNTERILIPSIKRDVFPLMSGKQTYAIGPAAVIPDWVSPTRPLRIDYAGAIISAGSDFPLEIPLDIITAGQWSRLQKKGIPDVFPRKLYYQNSVPAGQINLWPNPSDATVSLAVYTWQQLAPYVAGTDTVIVPQAWLRALIFNLAWELLPRENRAKTQFQIVQDIAVKSKAEIMDFNKLHYPEMADLAA